MKGPGVIVHERGRRTGVELSTAELSELLTALHCRRTPRSRQIIEKLTRVFGPKKRSRGCPEPGSPPD